MKYPLEKTPFAGQRFSDRTARAYEELVGFHVQDTIAQYYTFVNRDNRVVDKTKWRPVRTRENITVFRPASSSSSSAAAFSASWSSSRSSSGTQSGSWSGSGSWAGSGSGSGSGLMSSAGSGSGSILGSASGPSSITRRSYTQEGVAVLQENDASQWGVPQLLCVGSIVGTLDDAIYGAFSPTTEEMLINTSYVKNEVENLHVLQQFHGPTVQDPFYFRGVKWVMAVNPTKGTVTRERDTVYMHGTGIQDQPNGDRLGYLIMHSVKTPLLPELHEQGVVRAKLANCYIFKQRAPNTVEVYSWSYFDAGGQMIDRISLILSVKGHIACWKLTWCGQNKKLVWMMTEAAAARRLYESRHGHQDDMLRALRPREASASSSQCILCNKRYTLLHPRRQCDLCRCSVCSRCLTTRKLVYTQENNELTMVPTLFCKVCLTMATNRNSAEVARQIHIYSGWDGVETTSARVQSETLSPRTAAVMNWPRAPSDLSVDSIMHGRDTDESIDLYPNRGDPLDTSKQLTADRDLDWDTMSDSGSISHYQYNGVTAPTPRALLPVAAAGGPSSGQEAPSRVLDYQKQLWMQMNQLCLAAEKAYSTTQQNAHVMHKTGDH